MNIQDLLKLAENEPVKVYVGDPQDSLAVLHWWLELCDSGEIDKVMFPNSQHLAPFIHLFQSGSCRLVYNTDDSGKIRLAAWGQPVHPGIIFFSFWCRKSFRTRTALALGMKLYLAVFDMCEIIFGVTKQEKLLKFHTSLGYKIIGKFPQLWGGDEEGYLVSLTRADFKAAIGV